MLQITSFFFRQSLRSNNLRRILSASHCSKSPELCSLRRKPSAVRCFFLHSSLYFLNLVLTIIAIEVAKNCTNVLPVNDSLSETSISRAAQARFERFKRIFNDPSFLVSAPSFSGIGYFVAYKHPIAFVAELLVHLFIVDGVVDDVVLLMFFKDFF